ncbi:MAG: hypothetical protein MMC23_006635 [Stictis urceolatum]|nr:hypothetical protein [Stictis urceolata]
MADNWVHQEPPTRWLPENPEYLQANRKVYQDAPFDPALRNGPVDHDISGFHAPGFFTDRPEANQNYWSQAAHYDAVAPNVLDYSYLEPSVPDAQAVTPLHYSNATDDLSNHTAWVFSGLYSQPSLVNVSGSSAWASQRFPSLPAASTPEVNPYTVLPATAQWGIPGPAASLTHQLPLAPSR